MTIQTEKSLPEGVYPLSTQQGLAIPLDTARPNIGYYRAVTAGGTSSFTLEDTRFNIISVMSTTYATLSSISDPIVGADPPVARTFELIPNMVYELMVEKNLSVTNRDTATNILIVNLLERWTQLQNTGAYGSTR